MADRRMISKSISVSEKVNSMSLFARLLYTWMIPHSDDFGRLPGSPMKVKALVVPMAEQTKDDVEQAIREMVEQKLIDWYEVDGKLYIQIRNFEKHQTGLHKRTKSMYPAPEDGTPVVFNPAGSVTFRELPGNSGNVPEIPGEEKRSEVNRSEVNKEEEDGRLSDQPPDPLEEAIDPLEQDIQEIEQHFILRRGRGWFLSVKDQQSMYRLLQEGFTKEEIIAGIDHAFDTYQPAHAQDTINTFRYCERVIRDLKGRKEANEERVSAGARDTGKDREASPKLSKPGALRPISDERRRELEEFVKNL